MDDNGAPVAKKPRRLEAPPISETSLELVVRFLEAKELGKASMVCKTWRDDLKPPAKASSGGEEDEEEAGVVNNSEAIWKQAAQNTNPSVIQALTKSAAGSDKTPLDYHALASGALSRKLSKTEPPKPTFRIEDLITVVELKKKIVTMDKNDKKVITYDSIGAFTCNDCSSLLSEAGGELDMKVDTENSPVCFDLPNKLRPTAHNGDFLKWVEIWNKFHEELKRMKSLGDQGFWLSFLFPPFQSCSYGMVASLFFFRRDNWRSVRLFDNIGVFCDGYDRTREAANASTSLQAWEGQPFAQNASGMQAMGVLVKNEASSIKARVKVDIAAILPERGSTDEQKWLRELRKARPADADWTEQEQKEISDVLSFKFRMESMTVDFALYRNDELEDINDGGDFLLLLEGLDWK